MAMANDFPVEKLTPAAWRMALSSKFKAPEGSLKMLSATKEKVK